MPKLRVDDDTRYGIASNDVLTDDRLSFKAKGIFAYLQSKPDDWDFSSERIADDAADERDSVRSGLQELEYFGYLTRTKTSKGRGKFEVDYHLSWKPLRNATKSRTDFTASKNTAPKITATKNPAVKKEGATKTEDKKKESLPVGKPTEAEAAEGGLVPETNRNEMVDGLVAAIKEACDQSGILYAAGKQERNRAWNILTAKEFGDNAEKTGLDRVTFAVQIVRAAAKLPYCPTANNCETVYANYARVYQAVIKEKEKQKITQKRG